MADCLQIDALSRSSQAKHVTYKGIDWLWSQDLQGGGYTNITQLQYDTQSVSNSGQFIVWSQAFLSIPYTITMTGVTANTNVVGSVTFKSGFWNLVESLQISCQNKTVNNLCSKTNMAQCIRVLLNADLNKGKTSLPTYGFTQDTAESNTYAGGITRNNRILGAFPASNNPPAANAGYASLYPTTNFGLLDRIKLLNYAADGTVQTQANITNVERGTAYTDTVTNTTQHTTGVAIIPLKYLSDFFSENNLGMPLRNLRMYLQLNVNQGSFTYTAATNGTSASTFPYQTIPIIVTDAGVANITGPTSTVTLAIGSYNGSTTPTRLYYPTVQLEESTINKLNFPLRKSITYRDIQFFQLINQPAGAAFNWQISNAIPGLKRLFIMPAISASVLQNTLPSWASASSSTPGTTDPFVALSNVSLQINTRQLWSNNILYEYEQFIEQMLPNRLNGDTSDFVAGSLISQQQWLSSYRYYVFDCSKVPSLLNVTANTPVNVQLLATNNTQLAMDLYCWAEVETDVVLETTPITTYTQ